MACDAQHPEPKLSYVVCQVPEDTAHADHFWRSRGGLTNEVFIWPNTAFEGVVPVPGKSTRDALVPDKSVRLEMQRRLAGQGRVGNEHPDTSIEAARQELGGQRLAVLQFIRARGEEGATAAELVAAGAAPNVQLAGARLQELRGETEVYEAMIERRVDADGKLMRRALPGQRPGAIHWALS